MCPSPVLLCLPPCQGRLFSQVEPVQQGVNFCSEPGWGNWLRILCMLVRNQLSPTGSHDLNGFRRNASYRSCGSPEQDLSWISLVSLAFHAYTCANMRLLAGGDLGRSALWEGSPPRPASHQKDSAHAPSTVFYEVVSRHKAQDTCELVS
jgi:hypothetical protein